MSKFFYNRETTRIYAKKPFIVIECKILTTHKKVNKGPYWLVKNTTHFIRWFEREHLIQLTDSREWKAQSLRGKWRNQSQMNAWMNSQWIRTWKVNAFWKIGQFFAGFFLISKRRKLHCSLTGQKFWSQVKKKSSRHLIYARACVKKKDFVHSGSIGLV